MFKKKVTQKKSPKTNQTCSNLAIAWLIYEKHEFIFAGLNRSAAELEPLSLIPKSLDRQQQTLFFSAIKIIG